MTDAPSKPGSPLRGRYLVRNPAWNAALRIADEVFLRTARVPRSTPVHSADRILLAVGGHLGDAVIATTIIPELVARFPNAQLGMLLPSWSNVVIEGHPRLTWIHNVDHWKLDRSARSAAEKRQRYSRGKRDAVEAIRAVGYDLAIDLYAFYPNSSHLLWEAGVPARAGYVSGGCGSLYTHALEWAPDATHTARRQLRLLDSTMDFGQSAEMAYDLPPIPAAAVHQARVLCGAGESSRAYVVLHPGTGDAKKAWPLANWQVLARSLVFNGHGVVISGAGSAEREIASAIAEAAPGALNLADSLSWMTFRAVLNGASGFVGCDSVAGHLAAAEGTPVVSLMAAMSDPEHWRPLGSSAALLTTAVPCAPCFQSGGCAAMTCIREVRVADVVRALELVMKEKR